MVTAKLGYIEEVVIKGILLCEMRTISYLATIVMIKKLLVVV